MSAAHLAPVRYAANLSDTPRNAETKYATMSRPGRGNTERTAGMTDLNPEGIEKAAEELYLSQKDDHHPAWAYVNGWARDAYLEDTTEAITAYLAHAHPTLTTVAELDALPVGAVVLDASGPCQRLDMGEGVSWWAAAGYEDGCGSDEIDLPARVLHWGDR